MTDDFDKLAGDFYKNMAGQIPAEDHVGQAAASMAGELKAFYNQMDEDGQKEFIARMRDSGVPTDNPDVMWKTVTQIAEAEVIRQLSGDLGMDANSTKAEINTAIQIQQNIAKNIERMAGIKANTP